MDRNYSTHRRAWISREINDSQAYGCSQYPSLPPFTRISRAEQGATCGPPVSGVERAGADYPGVDHARGGSQPPNAGTQGVRQQVSPAAQGAHYGKCPPCLPACVCSSRCRKGVLPVCLSVCVFGSATLGGLDIVSVIIVFFAQKVRCSRVIALYLFCLQQVCYDRVVTVGLLQ